MANQSIQRVQIILNLVRALSATIRRSGHSRCVIAPNCAAFRTMLE